MIIFPTCHQDVYNYMIHNFLEMEVFNELFQWTEDSFYHKMCALHELLLYNFVDYMADLQQEVPGFNQIYIDEKGHFLIEQASQKDFTEDNDWSVEECRKIYYDIISYPDALFIDTDFLCIDKIYNARKAGKTMIEERLGINIDYYFELLPLDIQEQYKSKHITLTSEVHSMLKYVEKRMQHGNLYKLFWENESPVKVERIQLILENIMDAYFYNQEVEITREALLGNGKVDFKLYKTDHEDEKVLMELKRGSSSYLKKGYEKQLTDYMLSTSYKNAFYLIACFNDSEYERSVRFIKNNVYTDTIQLYINISILDLRKRKTASIS